MNSQAITNGQALATSIFSNGEDTVKNEFHRGAMIVGGGIIAAGLGLACSTTGMSPAILGFFATDIANDFRKLKLLKEKIEALHSFTLDSKSADFEKAKASIEFQENVYKNIKTYTETAGKIKIAAALGFLSSIIGFKVMMSSFGINEDTDFFINESRYFMGQLLDHGGLTVGLASSTAVLNHYLTREPALEKTNRKLANQFTQIK